MGISATLIEVKASNETGQPGARIATCSTLAQESDGYISLQRPLTFRQGNGLSISNEICWYTVIQMCCFIPWKKDQRRERKICVEDKDGRLAAG